MHYISIFIFTLSTLVASETCSKQCLRKEIHDLSQKEWSAFSSAVLKVAELKPSGESILETYASMHSTNKLNAHGSAQFLPWHRQFLRNFELDLQKIDPSVCLPYWSWELESHAPQNSSLWTSLGRSTVTSECVTGGLFDSLRFLAPTMTEKNCIQRNQAEFVLSAPQFLGELFLKANNVYSDFELSLELVHGTLHNSIGFDMRTMLSPRDILFYLHHANVDKLWYDYQYVLMAANAPQYNGLNPANGRAALTDVMIPFGVSVGSVIKTSDLCFTYQSMSALASFTPIQINNTQTTSQSTSTSSILIPSQVVSKVVSSTTTSIAPSTPITILAKTITQAAVLASVTNTIPTTTSSKLLPTSQPTRRYLYKQHSLPKPISTHWIQMNFNLVNKIIPQRIEVAVQNIADVFNSTLIKMNSGAYVAGPLTKYDVKLLDDGNVDGFGSSSMGIHVGSFVFILAALCFVV